VAKYFRYCNRFGISPALFLDQSDSFYCGDAAGRQPSSSTNFKRKDHSDSDFGFALNCNLKFYLPEQIFDIKLAESLQCITQNDSQWWFSIDYELPDYRAHPVTSEIKPMPYMDLSTYSLIMLVGSPGSGKSTFISRNFKGPNFKIVSQDILGRRSRCVEKVKDLLNQKCGHVVVDNTSPNKSSRTEFVSLNKGKTLCIHINTEKEHCIHNNKYRRYLNHAAEIFTQYRLETFDKDAILDGLNGNESTPIVAIHTYWKNFEKPTESEGFDVITVPFVPVFDCEFERKVWSLHL
jgi:bifunctional polynucleotide phosphatase/kinase